MLIYYLEFKQKTNNVTFNRLKMSQGGRMKQIWSSTLGKKVKKWGLELKLWVFLTLFVMAGFLFFCLISMSISAITQGKIAALLLAMGSALGGWLAIYIIFFAIPGRSIRSYIHT